MENNRPIKNDDTQGAQDISGVCERVVTFAVRRRHR